MTLEAGPRKQPADLGALTNCLLLGSEQAATEPGWSPCPVPCWFSASWDTGASDLPSPEQPGLRPSWSTFHVWCVSICTWSSQPERAAVRAQFIWSAPDRCLLCSKSPPKCLFLPSDYTGSLQWLAQTRRVWMEPSGHRACDQPFSWSLAKGLLWSGISDDWSTRACATCSCGCLLLKCYFHYGVAIWMPYNNVAATFFAPKKDPLVWPPFSERPQAPSPALSEQSQSCSSLSRHSPSLQLKLFSCVGLLETMNKYNISTFTFLDTNEVTLPEAETSGFYCKCYL